MNFLLLITIILFVFFIFCLFTSSKKENAVLKAYHFGFPTSGSYNYGGGPLEGRWGYHGYANWGLPPRSYIPIAPGPRSFGGPRRRWYYKNYIKPYLTGTCYSSSKDEDCTLGYRKTRKDMDNDGIIDEWMCCRR